MVYLGYMTKEQYIITVNKFNACLETYLPFLGRRIRCWKNFKLYDELLRCYGIRTGQEFQHWLKESRQPDFVSRRFCPICGAWIDKFAYKRYLVACHEHQEQVRLAHKEIGMLRKYGGKSPFCDRTIREKSEQTTLRHYGVKYALQSKNVHSKTIKNGLVNDSYKKGALKGRSTRKTKYGDANYNNPQQISQTKKNWGADRRLEYVKKMRKTKTKRYGNPIFNNPEKIKETCKRVYGVSNVSKAPEIRKLIGIRSIASKIKNHTTGRELMNDPQRRYNFVSAVLKTKQENHTTCRDLMQNLSYKENFVKKCYTTRKINHTFNTSKPEETIYTTLITKWPKVEHQYKSSDYPWVCDFYIPDLKLYIEYQGTWTHGSEPFDPNNSNHLTKLEIWKSKNTKFYTNAIKVWTISDVEKRNHAKNNNLNWIEFFDIKSFEEWFNANNG